jgi:hypothetical protein
MLCGKRQTGSSEPEEVFVFERGWQRANCRSRKYDPNGSKTWSFLARIRQIRLFSANIGNGKYLFSRDYTCFAANDCKPVFYRHAAGGPERRIEAQGHFIWMIRRSRAALVQKITGHSAAGFL